VLRHCAGQLHTRASVLTQQLCVKCCVPLCCSAVLVNSHLSCCALFVVLFEGVLVPNRLNLLQDPTPCMT
jgi:hypothetical protein